MLKWEAISTAWAQAPGPSGQSGGISGVIVSFFPFILIFIVFYILLILPQQKKSRRWRETLADLKKGDRVLTRGGIVGRVVNLGKNTVTVDVDGVRLKFRRSHIEELVGEGEEE